MQTLLVVLIVTAAAFLLGRRFYRSVKKVAPPACGCGCAGCASQGDCQEADQGP
jgi:hypothetical protein